MNMNIKSTATKKGFEKIKLALGLFLLFAISATVLITCDIGGGSNNDGSTELNGLSYANIKISASSLDPAQNPTGGSIGRRPIWEQAGITANYSIALVDDSNLARTVPSKITINANSGSVLIAKGATAADSASYTITATGTGNYTGTVTADIIINITTDPQTELTGFDYNDFEVEYSKGTQALTTQPQPQPVWDVAGKTAIYSINATPDTDTLPTGITINANSGYISVSDTVAAGDYNATVVARGIGAYKDTEDTDGNPTPQSKAIIITVAPTGISGELYYTSIDFNAIEFGTTTINIADHKFAIQSGFSVTIGGVPITVNMAINGATSFLFPVWSEASQTIKYSITKKAGVDPATTIAYPDLDSGISIDSRTGIITALSTVPITNVLPHYTATVTITGTGNYTGNIPPIDVTIAVITNGIETGQTTDITTTPIDRNDLLPAYNAAVNPDPISFSISPPSPNLISPEIDANTGEVTVKEITNPGVYTITATGVTGLNGVIPGPNSIIPGLTRVGNEVKKDFYVTVTPKTKLELSEAIRLGKIYISSIGNFNYIITSNISDMSYLFQNDDTFNGDISEWNVSRVTNMYAMFNGATAFDQDISKWIVNGVIFMDFMFNGATKFNQPIGRWLKVSNLAYSMKSMFNAATSFNQDISDWAVSSTTRMDYMFKDATAFNQDISDWKVKKVIHMNHMFNGASAFNQNISDWPINKVLHMDHMFDGATAFAQNLDAWGAKLNEDVTIIDMFTDSGVSTPPNWCTAVEVCNPPATAPAF